MDAVASAVSDLILTNEPLPLLVNVVHPRPVAWHDVFAAMSKHIAKEPVPFTDFGSWVQKLEALSESATADDLQRMVSRYRVAFLGPCIEHSWRVPACYQAARLFPSAGLRQSGSSLVRRVRGWGHCGVPHGQAAGLQ